MDYSLIIDIVVIGLLAIFAIIGLSKGFVKQVGKLIAVVAAVALAVMLFKQVGNWLYTLDKVNEWETKLIGKLNENTVIASLSSLNEESITTALTALKIPTFVQNLLLKLIDTSALPTGETVSLYLGGVIVQYACLAAAFLGLFFIGWIAVAIIVKLISKVVDFVPGAGIINRLLGCAISVAKFLIVIWVLLYGLSLLTLIPIDLFKNANNFVLEWANKTTVAKFLVEHNGVTWIVGKFFTK